MSTPDNMGRPVPANERENDWDGLHECPECGDRTGNMVNHDEPLIDCLDHIEDGDLREYARKETREVYHRHYKRIVELNTRIASLEGQIDALNALVEKKDKQLDDLVNSVEGII